MVLLFGYTVIQTAAVESDVAAPAGAVRFERERPDITAAAPLFVS